MSQLKNAVGYIRCSTKGQVTDDKFGIEAQKMQILEYCAKNDYSITEWFIEKAVCGVQEERAELDRILFDDTVTNPPITTVIVAKSDRLAREINLYFYYKFLLKKKNIDLVSVQEDFGEMGAFASVLESLTLFVAEQERKNIASRTGAGRKVKASAGGYSGGRSPYGYDIQNGKLVINENEAKLVVRIFELRDSGMTLSDVAEKINDEGYTTRKGKKFYASNIKSITDNRKTYQGYYKYGSDMNWVKGIHEPILPE